MWKKIKKFAQISCQHNMYAGVGLTLEHLDFNVPPWVVHQQWDFPSKTEQELKIINANVDQILFTSHFPFPTSRKEAIIGTGRGMWDKFVRRFSKTIFYRSMEMRYIDEVSWEETPIYQKSLQKINKGNKKGWGTSGSVTYLQKKCDSMDQLYESIKKEGYKSNIENKWNKSISGIPIPDEIKLAINRNGKFIRMDEGRHRLAIAKILNISTIPAIVQLEHKKHSRDVDVLRKIKS